MALKHQHLCFEHCLVAQGEVNSHLVTIEVGVERCTCQWVQLNSFTFDHLGLEGLNSQTVKCRCTVEQYWVSLHYVFKDIPNYGFAAVNNLLGTLNGLNNATLNELANDKWLVKFGCHQLRQTALTHLQFRTNDNYRTS